MRVLGYSFILLIFALQNAKSQEIVSTDIVELSRLAFEENPTLIRSNNSVDASIAELQIQKSIFDYNFYTELSYNLSSYNLFDADPRNQFLNERLNSRTGNINIGIQKLFRSSLLANFSVGYDLSNNNYPINRFGENVKSFSPDHASSAKLTITQPLLRGKGRDIATAPEKIQELYIKNSEENLEFTNSYEILQIAYAYWDYLATYKSLDIYQKNESRVRNMLEITNELVKADKKPASELVQIEADLANQERLTNVAERTFYNAKLNLGLAVGLSEVESRLIDIPTNEFPTIENSLYEFEINVDSLKQLSYVKRADLKVAQYNYEVAQIELEVAQNNLRPQLDASLLLNYGGENMGNGIGKALSTFSNHEGRNLSIGVGLRYSIPINNNLANGNLAKSNVRLNDINVVNNNLKRTIDIRISTVLNNLHKSVAIFEKAQQALEYNKEAYNNEKIKFQNGLTTLLNLILFQERLTYAELEYLQAHQQFANAIVSLRHETGTLIQQEGESGFTINRNVFYTLPSNFNN